ncbi:hypothetical protein HY732_02390 [Candidatus Uhrbacteria bacterium]|nr:hypothetical protein [Candidatus Uhrbacteria bacterium]
MAKGLVGYLRGQAIPPTTGEKVEEVLVQWRQRNIPLWGQDNTRDERRAALVLGNALTTQEPVHFFAPVCPDYPNDSRSGILGTGIGKTIPPVISFLKGATGLLGDYGVPYRFSVMIADTETDLEEVVALLANSADDFRERCKKTAATVQETAPDLFCGAGKTIATFSEYFQGRWHQMQNVWEEVVRRNIQKGSGFACFLNQLAFLRKGKYEAQTGRECSSDDCIAMAVRHYAQYHALGYWMRQHGGAMMVNTDSPNLRAVRRPFEIKEYCPCLPVVSDQLLRIPIIIP